ncbi:ABC transporter substrate-binding protein [Roseateles depolymerans]|uniref:Extracellular solute-binding protein, family 1 n=1 Tax=Roseateles depolymerans TaxID=76731 RepID=A0A0U3N4Z0_9BURK|nr:extracellular solute-binding protein [Roseateles depolymerans]ALV07275.1 Extracellular solute-binding protein, family 1 [Roseateles depolymerans]REG20258.1 carbohydrate ABC transporter substrate-binding protein (CUT1 family) [Roseateles depolymerans]
MRRWVHHLSALALTWLGGLALAAAAQAADGSSTAPAASSRAAAPTVTLTVAAFPAIDEIVRSALPAWRALHPEVEVKVLSREVNDHHTAMTTALSTAKGLPDVMALEIPYLGRFSQGTGLQDLAQPPFSLVQDRDRFVRYAFDQATTAQGAVVAVPTDIAPGTLLYRTDLLSRAGLTDKDLTTSWEGFVAAGVRIKASTGAFLLAHARDMKDILIRTGLQPGEGLYFDDQSRPLVTSPRFVRAFELARTVRRQKLDARVSAWSSDWTEGFKRGRIATQMSGAWLAGHLNNWLAPDTRGLWRATQLPEEAYAAYGGTYFAMPRLSDPGRKAMAYEFIRFMTLNRDQQLAAFKSQDAFPALVDAQTDAFFDLPLPFLGGQRARRDWREAAHHIRAVPVHKQDAFAREVIDTELDKVLDRDKDIATALADAQRLLQLRARR